MPRRCKCRKGKCPECSLCTKCRCKCAPRESNGCHCHRAKCPHCALCVGHLCKCPSAGSPPRAKRQRVSVAPTQHVARGPPASGTASDSANAVPTAGSTAAAVLRYITAALPEPASYSHRKRSAGESGWEAHIKVLSGGSGRISASSLQDKDISGRVVRLYADTMMQLLAVTVAELLSASSRHKASIPNRGRTICTPTCSRELSSL